MPICDDPVPVYDFGDGHVARCFLYDERAKDQRPVEVSTAPVSDIAPATAAAGGSAVTVDPKQ
jgi:uncharacterized protein (UPF0179 family)